MPTTFKDGPAAGQRLLLIRAPVYLRVVQDSNGKWDALDLEKDTPQDDEKVHAYKLTGKPSMCHLNMGRKGSGFYPIAEYALCRVQPDDAVMRSRSTWVEWCEQQEASCSS